MASTIARIDTLRLRQGAHSYQGPFRVGRSKVGWELLPNVSFQPMGRSCLDRNALHVTSTNTPKANRRLDLFFTGTWRSA